MKRLFLFFLASSLFFFSCQRKEETPAKKSPRLYTIGIFQVIDSPTLNEVRNGFLKALNDRGIRDGVEVRLRVRNAMGDVSEVQKIAQEFVESGVDMIIALSTQCLQAAIIATNKIPIIFTSVANPFLAGAGKSDEDHLPNVTGVASRGPIKQTLMLIREILPEAKRIGTLWTPSEINSEYYLELMREAANELGLEIVALPVTSTEGVLTAAQLLMNKKIDCLYPVSDNTINASFTAIGRFAEENGLPLFGSFLLAARLGACAAMGWDFFDMGYMTGEIALRIKNNEPPSRIPFQYMTGARLHVNLQAASKQGVQIPETVLKRTNEVIGLERKF